MTQNTIGIDISKATLDVHRLADGQSIQFENAQKGFDALKRWVRTDPPDLVIYEATGPYSRALEKAFADELALVKVNPMRARRFAQACGIRVKTDRVDARMLAGMGAALDLAPDMPPAEDTHDLKELNVARLALVKERTRLKTRSQTLTLGLLRKQAAARLAQIERQLKGIDAEIRTRLTAIRERARACAILCSIPGIGAVTAASLLIDIPELGSLSGKQAASLAGLAPVTRQSGNWQGKSYIQGGRKRIRDALYMPALVAIQHNPERAAKYDALITKGKPPKVALTAVMRKLLILANALIRDDREWALNAP